MNGLLRRLPRVSVTAKMLQGWPRGARLVSGDLIRRYGFPHEATPDALVWYFTGPWKRTVVHRRGALHRFPYRHWDYVEQTVDLHVPAEACAALVAFNGSLVVDRTRGELTVHCLNEATNFLIVNLAHDIVLGKVSAEQAREICASAAEAMRRRWPVVYAVGLSFAPEVTIKEAVSGTADPDRELKALPVRRT